MVDIQHYPDESGLGVDALHESGRGRQAADGLGTCGLSPVVLFVVAIEHGFGIWRSRGFLSVSRSQSGKGCGASLTVSHRQRSGIVQLPDSLA